MEQVRLERRNLLRLISATASASLLARSQALLAASPAEATLRRTIDGAILPLMTRYDIPGMAIGLVAGGHPFTVNYGVASTDTRAPVTDRTLFELGSVSKTLTVTLAADAETAGRLSFTDPVRRFLPGLKGTSFGDVRLRDLATHTGGGFPLQVPDGIATESELLAYLSSWKPSCAAGTCRTYSNITIGVLGLIAARSMEQEFAPLLEQRILAPLGMRDSFIDVPASRRTDYAQGYAKDGTPARMAAGVLSSEAYGVKASARAMVRFLLANMGLLNVGDRLARAVALTHTGYFAAGPMVQDLIWEQYEYPVTLSALLEGNSARMIFEPTRVTAIDPPTPPIRSAWLNKTGSTNGFGAYVAFVPARRTGVVLLANRNYPIPERVRAAYQIMQSLEPAF